MKVAFVSNQNNFGYALVRYFRDRGIDADLLISSQSENEDYIYHPSKDSLISNWKDYTKYINWGGDLSDFFKYWKNNSLRKQIKEDLAGYDKVIGSSTIPAFMHLIGKKLDMFYPMGTDARSFPDMRWGKDIFTKRNTAYNIRAYYQRRGIRDSLSILTGINDQYNLDRMKPKGKILEMPIPGFYRPEYSALENQIEQDEELNKFLAKKSEFDFTIASHNRQVWRYYRNDLLIRAVRSVVEKGHNPLVVMFESGTQVEESKELIRKLGVEKNFFWFGVSPRSKVIYVVDQSDLVVLQLNPIPIIQSGTIFESIALAKPVIQARSPLPDRIPEELIPPVRIANSLEELTEEIISFALHRERFLEIGKSSLKWFEDIVENRTIETIERQLELCL